MDVFYMDRVMDTDQSRRNPHQDNKEIIKAKFLGSPKMKDYILHRRKKKKYSVRIISHIEERVSEFISDRRP